MKRFIAGLIAATLALCAGPALASPGKALLDGKSFDVMISDPTKPAAPDQLQFDSGTFVSTACAARKFEKAAYTATATATGTTFEVKASSPTDGTVIWKGTVTGDQVAGTMVWTPKSGKKETHAFKGAVSAPAAAAAAASLDGKAFDIQITPQGKAPSPDKLVFGSGMFESTQCDQFGFAKASYATSNADGAVAFEATSTSPTEGTTMWKGRVRGDAIEGTMEWTPKTGDKLVHTFSGMAGSHRAGPAKPLDGKTFAVKFGVEGKEMNDNELSFATGMFQSAACLKLGYTKAIYLTDTVGDAVTFTSTTVSPTDGTEHWKGTVKGDAIDGTMSWEPPGKMPVKYVFSGSVVKK